MVPQNGTECSLNTTECILMTVASILGEIQEQNSEYNWDPLTFVFTAIIGVIATLFAALAVVQSLLAAGPGRTKSGYYAIGPWSQLNDRKFDWVEMRFRTTSETPLLILDCFAGFEWDNIIEADGSHVNEPKVVIRSHQDPKTLRKGQGDYFAATWLTLLTALQLDIPKLWGTKLTGADYIPSEFPAVPAYGSIRVVVTLAIIFSRGASTFTIDRETGLPRAQGRNFNLVFRQHPLLGAMGFFEMHGEVSPKHSLWRREIRGRFLHANGYMDVLEDEPRRKLHMWYLEDRWNRSHQYLSEQFSNKARLECSCGTQEPNVACCKLLQHFSTYQPNPATDGPLYPLVADAPKFIPFFFPHKRAKLREKLDTLFLQSRFWSMTSSAFLEFSPDLPTYLLKDELFVASAATSWARTTMQLPVSDLKLRPAMYALCLAYLADDSAIGSESREECMKHQHELKRELSVIDIWLKQAGPIVLCRKLILGVIGNGIQQMIDGRQRPDKVAMLEHENAATSISPGQFVSPALRDKLDHFLQGLGQPNRLNHLYPSASRDKRIKRESLTPIRRETVGLLRKIGGLWETEKSGVGRHFGNPHNASQHPLDDLLIYRAVIVSLIYLLSIDSSVLIDEVSYGLVIPFM